MKSPCVLNRPAHRAPHTKEPYFNSFCFHYLTTHKAQGSWPLLLESCFKLLHHLSLPADPTKGFHLSITSPIPTEPHFAKTVETCPPSSMNVATHPSPPTQSSPFPQLPPKLKSKKPIAPPCSNSTLTNSLPT